MIRISRGETSQEIYSDSFFCQWVNQGHIHDIVEWVGEVVVIDDDEQKESTILEDDCPGFLQVPLGPWDQTLLANVAEWTHQTHL